MKFSELPLDHFFLCQNTYSGGWYGWRKISEIHALALDSVGRPLPYCGLILFAADYDVAVYA